MNNDELLALNLVHPIHTTERRSFRGCRQRWHWIFREFHYPLATPRALEFGVAYHRAMEIWYNPETWNDPDREIVNQALALTEFDLVVKEQKERYVKLNGPMQDELKVDYLERVQLGHDMIKYYTGVISPKLDKGFTPLGVEVPFEIPLGFNCKCDICWRRILKYWSTRLEEYRAQPHEYVTKMTSRETWDGLPVTYGGRLDMIAQDDRGRLWIFDWKTTGKIMEEGSAEAFLELEDQITSYVVSLFRLGRPVAGFVYHEQKKAVPEPPTLLSRKMKGRSYSTAKNQNVTYEMYLQTVMLNDAEALAEGHYDEFLSWLKDEGPKFYQRHQVHRNHHQIQSAWDDMVNEAKDIIENPRVYPQPGRFSCNTCAFRQPCLGRSMGEDYEYTLKTLFETRTKHYFEEADENPSTDVKLGT